MATRISELFSRLKSQKQMAFMPFITSGDPDLATTAAVIQELAKRGVDMIEVGFPYSDPIADGPVIQASYTRALSARIQIQDIFAMIREISSRGVQIPPLIGMVSYAIVFRQGPEVFIDRAQKAGFSGLIIPDLPADEASEVCEIATKSGIDLIQLIAPTTTEDRTARILRTARGFLYCISVAGTTGVRDQLPTELKQQLQWIKSQTELPLAVGFGISRPEQVHELKGFADGVIVGSAFVRLLGTISSENVAPAVVVSKIGELAQSFLQATRMP